MSFFSRLPATELIHLCRVLRHNLDAGLSIVHIFRQQAERGPRRVRPVAGRIHTILKRGYDLERALKDEQKCFPPLFVALTRVGEHTGTLPEVFAALEAYYSLQQRLKRQFLSQITLPVLQLCAAICVISLMIFVLGLIASVNNTQAMDPLGIGLTGASGALIFFFGSFGTIFALIAGYFLLSNFLAQKAVVDALLLRLPAVGPCLTALALSRFCLAMRYTFETALPVDEALELSLMAAGNSYFAVKTPVVKDAIRVGDDLTAAMTKSQLFSADFLGIVATGEESGRLAEVMRQQAKFYEEETEHRLVVLTRLAGFGVWLFVAILIIIAIFRLVTKVYLEPLNQYLNM
jgi:type II secretory pathway component PulF